jgi:hypothetical protein
MPVTTTEEQTQMRPFEVRHEGLLPATPEEAWAAITRQTAGWLWEITYEPRVGGAERGLTTDGGTVTAWDPPRHFATRAQRPDGWFNRVYGRDAFGWPVGVAHDLFADGVDGPAVQDGWRVWLDGVLVDGRSAA